MMADHGEPCSGTDATFCMHGGKCFKIPSMSTLTCVCNENYIGSRCEQFQLPSQSSNGEQTVMVAAAITLLIIILLVLAVIIYHVYKLKKQQPKSEESRSLSDLP